jgi:hypothetical protein
MRAAALLAITFALSTLACGELPGELVGTYKLAMKLEENTCGNAAVNLLDGHRYAAELRSDDEYGYWRVPSQPPMRGSYERGKFRFENAVIVANEGADAGPRGCTLRQVDVLAGKLTDPPDAGNKESDDDDDDAGTLDASDDENDAGEDENENESDAGEDESDDSDPAPDKDEEAVALRGSHVFTVSAVTGTNCTTALTPRGAFEKLPCTVRYTVIGLDTKPF